MPRRDRIRRRRSPFSKWAGRVLGVAGTAVLLACAVVIATMVLPADDERVVSPAPAATPAAEAEAKAKAKPEEEAEAEAHSGAERAAPPRGRRGPPRGLLARRPARLHATTTSCAC